MTTSTASNDFVSGFPVALDPAAIEDELASMWSRRGGSAEEEENTGGVTRVTLGNLLWLGTSRHVPRIREVFGELVRTYPCRLFLLEYQRKSDKEGIECYVNAHCFLTGDARHEVCCEEIHLRFGPRGIDHIMPSLLSLLMPDMPTGLWTFSAQPEQYDRIMPALRVIADLVVAEVGYLADPAAGLRQWSGEGRGAVSLAWFRYHPIREQIAQVFDDARCRSHLPEIESVDVVLPAEVGARDVRVAVSLLVGWLAAQLGWTARGARDGGPFVYAQGGRSIEVRVRRELAASAGEFSSLVIEAANGFRVSLVATDAGHLERIVDDPRCKASSTPRYVQVAPLNEAKALGYALNARLKSALFRAAAAQAWPLLQHMMEKGEQ